MKKLIKFLLDEQNLTFKISLKDRWNITERVTIFNVPFYIRLFYVQVTSYKLQVTSYILGMLR